MESWRGGRQLLLAGGGHSHALLLRRWLMQPRLRPPGTRITLVNRTGTALYSGMVPGLVAGLYRPEACAIDLRHLCDRAGVCFVQAEIRGLDADARELQLEGRPPLRYDRLSLDLGAVSAGGTAAMAVKPLEPFLAWLRALPAGHPVRIRGGGAAAVELALALVSRGHPVRLLLRGPELRLGSAAAARAAERMLAAAGVALERCADPAEPADLACTGSRAPAWLAASGLPVDPANGRVRTDACLRVLGRPELFACGDCAVIAADPRPPSGVWAVRAAPLLAANLRRSLVEPQRPLQPWRPQRRALQLLADPAGDPAAVRALALWGPFALGPWRWLWHWKERIDRRFMAGFAAGEAMEAGAAMACRGCAAKLAPATLAAALERLTGAAMDAEDAAPLATDATGSLLLQSVDGFPALLQDPWLNARLTTLHACSDLWACAASVDSAQALVTLPQAEPAIQEELLLQTLAGVRSVLDPLGGRLIGGHSLEGRDGAGLALALVVNGRAPAGAAWPKGPLQPGDALLLSRPIGTGVLFAAAMAGAARPDWLEQALAVMQASQAPLVALLAAHGCRACTDITGFGLLGHLGEMVHHGSGRSGGSSSDAGDPATPVQVELDAEAVPALAGALELLGEGRASTLAPANAQALSLLEGSPAAVVWAGASSPDPARQALLLDPQTCGPLLAALPAERAEAAVAALQAAGFPQATLIGRVRQAPGPLRPQS